jgi:hypothetical protein
LTLSAPASTTINDGTSGSSATLASCATSCTLVSDGNGTWWMVQDQ